MATRWVVTAATERVAMTNGIGEVAFTVTNPSTSPDRAMFTVLPGEGASSSWFTTAEPQRPVGAGSSTTYVVKVTIPPGTAPGTYALQGRVYSAESAPEETSVVSGRVVCEVAAAPVVTPPPVRWWLWALVAAGVLALVAIAILVLGGGDDEASGPLLRPIPEQPADGGEVDVDDPIRFEWSDANADEYRIVITELCAAPPCPDERDTVAGTSFQLDGDELTEGATYTWTVTAMRGGDGADEDDEGPQERESNPSTFVAVG